MARRRKTAKRNRYAAILLLVIVGGIGGASIVLWRRSRAPHERARRQAPSKAPYPALHVTPAQAAQRFRVAIERAGGEDVWVQKRGTAPPDAFTVLFVPRAYGVVEQAVLRTASRNGLRPTQLRLQAHQAGGRAVGVTAYAGNRPLCRWTMREVPRITRVAIVIDDLGQSLSAARELFRLRSSLTFSVMPHLAYSHETAEESHRQGFEVMLHLPMQPIADSAPDVSLREIKVGMGSGEVGRIIQSDLASVPYAAGVNNHMGSRATSDPRLMSEVMAALAARHLYYIDSRTIASSVALDAARRSGVPAFYRSVFLDDTPAVPYTLGQLRALCRVADRRGAALAIGHPYPSTIAALGQFLPQLERRDVQLVRVSALLRLEDVARLSPPATRGAPRVMNSEL